jgi:hypothetical protein
VLKKITVYDPDTMNTKELVINTVLIHSVNRHHKKDNTLTVHYAGRMLEVREPLESFMDRVNSGMDHEVFDKFKSLESQVNEINDKLNTMVTVATVEIAIDDLVNQMNASLLELEAKIKPKSKSKK